MRKSKLPVPMLPISALVIASALLLSPHIAAAGNFAIPKTTVHYGELNLHSSAGVQALYARLKSAAKNVCAAQDGRSLQAQFAFRACVATSLERAVLEVRNDAVLALHLENASAPRRS
jgi:UrcA family protein